MNLIKRLFTSVIAGTLLVSSSFNHVKASDREVRIYSGRHYNTDKKIYKKFAEETGIKIRLIEATGISLVERLKREGTNSKADVILLVDAARISNAAKSGLLQSYRSSKLDKNVPLEYRDPQARWYGLTRRVRVMVANPKKVDINSIKDYSDFHIVKSTVLLFLHQFLELLGYYLCYPPLKLGHLRLYRVQHQIFPLLQVY